MNPGNFHKNLKFHMTQKGLTALELSEKTGLSKVTIIFLVVGVREATIRHLKILTNYFKLDLNEFFR